MTLPAVTPVCTPEIRHYRGSRKPRDYRHDCGRLIMRAVLMPGCYIEMRCSKCARMCIITFEPDNGHYETIEEKKEEPASALLKVDV